MKYTIKRILTLIPILLAITFLSFALMRLAGSDVIEQKMLNTGEVISEQAMAEQRAALGLDRPFLVQYLIWLKNLLHGDMGVSFVTGKPVFKTFTSKLPATLLLTLVSVLLTVAVSVPLGIVCAVKKNTFTDYVIRTLSFIGNSMPNFFVALVLMYIFAIKLKLLPIISRKMNFSSVLLPAVTLSIAMSAKYVRQVRSAVLDELNKEYVTGLRSRGIKFSVILYTNVLKASLTSIISLLALSVGSLLGGTAVVESVFMWDGVGKLAVDAISMRDYPVIQSYVIWMAFIYVLVNLVTDLSYHLLDPRIRLKKDA